LAASDLKNGDLGNYQDSVTLPVSCEADENAVLVEDEDEPATQQLKDPTLMGVLEKVRYFCPIISIISTNFF